MSNAREAAEIRVRLLPGRDRPVRHGSSWVFSGAVDGIDRDAPAGSIADVYAADGTWIAAGLWNPDADLCVRVLTRDPEAVIGEDFLRDRIRSAAALRHDLYGTRSEWKDTTAFRMLFSEADGLSGLVADQYDGTLVLHVGGKAWERWLPGVTASLRETCAADRVLVRADPDAVRREGLSEDLGGDDAPSEIEFRENGYRFFATPDAGQKTGFYLDQRENRRKVAALARGRDVLSAYCYTGAFEVCAAHAGAKSVTGWDSSAPALALARRHQEANPCGTPVAYEEADVPTRLRQARDRRESWDLIVLDPPRLVTSRAGLQKGLRAYKDINLLALKLLRPGGYLATFTCSGLVEADTFLEMLGWAAHDAARSVRILEALGPGADHPVALGAPETSYLKGFLCRVD
jgi:23S rRNA (cytosine1962-C5)-methyltransferase